MIARRQMLGTTGLAGLFGVASPAIEEPQVSDKTMEDVKTAIDEFRKAYVHSRSFDSVAAIREQQRTYLRAAGKFPDFIEVGIDVWFALYDWNVTWGQQAAVSRDAGGRYTIPFIVSTVVLRPDLMAGYVGAGYDVK